MAYTVSTTVVETANPPAGADFPDSSIVATLSPRTRTYSVVANMPTMTFVAAVNTNIFPAGMTSLQHLYLRVSGGTITLKITTSLGAAQIIPVDDVLLHINSTTPITALTVSGTANVEMLACGI